MTTERPVNNDTPRPWYKKKRFIIPIAFIVLSIIGGATGGSKSSVTSSQSPAAPASSTSNAQPPKSDWFPAGFIEWAQDSNVAFRWAPSGYSCSEYATNGCYKAIFISRNGCPSNFYAAINLLDASKNVINYSNATLPTLLPMQKATLEFDDIEGTSKSALMSEISCL